MLIEQAPWHWTGPGVPGDLNEELGKDWYLVKQAPVTSHWILCDNADWALWRAGALLFKSGRELELRHAGHCLTARVKRKQWRFWWDLPEGPLRQMLVPLIGVRALIEQAQIERFERGVTLCNSDRKTVARLFQQQLDLEQYSPEREQNSPEPEFKKRKPSNRCGHVQLLPLRGYREEFEQIADRLETLLFDESWKRQTGDDVERLLLLQAGLQPAEPPTKVLGISPGEATELVVRRWAVALLQRARDQHWGLVADLDTEFLHQYRVALRKTRSLLALVKTAFPEARRQEWKLALSELARATNQVRDLDVFLLSEPNHRQLLPSDFEEGLDQLFGQCRRQRQQAFRRLRSFVQSQDYARKFDELTASFSEPPEFSTELAVKPIKPVVNGQLLRRYRKICRRIARLDSDSPAEQLHQLRIAGKKLRYLMEFFAELYPAKPMAKNIKATKNLQSLLGDFNDYSVQIAFLRERLERTESPALAAAVNGLIAVLYQQQAALRADLAETLRAFCTDSRRRKFEQLCRDIGDGL